MNFIRAQLTTEHPCHPLSLFVHLFGVLVAVGWLKVGAQQPRGWAHLWLSFLKWDSSWAKVGLKLE